MKKFVTIAELEQGDQSQPIWALNGSADSEVGQPGELHIGIPKINGTKTDNLHLPQTWLPICLTDQIPRNQLLASSEFRNPVNSGLLLLVTGEYASYILVQDGVVEERARLNEAKRAVREAVAHRSIAQSGAEIINTSEIVAVTEEVGSNELNPSFVMFTNNLANKSDIECLNLIRGRGKFSGREVKHLLKALADKEKTTAFLKRKTKIN